MSRKSVFARVVFLLVSIAVLVLLMPRSKMETHHFKVGEPWDESPVIAKDSFPVLKAEAQLARERDSLRQYYAPYYMKDEAVAERALAAFDSDFVALPDKSVPLPYKRHLKERLQDIYAKGVMDTEELETLRGGTGTQVFIYSQRSVDRVALGEILTTKEAYEYLMHDPDSLLYRHEVLANMQLQRYLFTNLVYDAEKSAQQQEEVDSWLVPYMGKPVQVGQKIVDRGQIVDEYTFQALKSLENFQTQKSHSERQQWSLRGGQTLYAAIMVLTLFFYFHQFRSDYVHSMRSVALVTSLSNIFVIVTYMMVQYKWGNVFVVPYCILPIFVRIFMDSRTAFMTHLFTILTCAVCLSNPYEFILVQVVGGLTAIYNMRQLSQRSELFRAVIAVTLACLTTYLCVDLLNGRFFNTGELHLMVYLYLLSAGGLTLISYLLLIPIERIFGFTSTVTLVELSNINNPLLRMLSEKAPGTFQHSLQVANLAAEVANALGAQSQLVRTGALYHDIGKIEHPEFFTENQAGVSPHEELTCLESASMIISHVDKGLALAERHRLPMVIRDFIRTHHGTGMARYFYITYQNQYPGEPVDPRPFSYPGPDPFTMEQAILMMADSVEAASRSLPEYTEESIQQMVEKIVDGQMQEGRFKRCPITLRDVDDAKRIFCAKLKTIYHGRIKYPELAKE